VPVIRQFEKMDYAAIGSSGNFDAAAWEHPVQWSRRLRGGGFFLLLVTEPTPFGFCKIKIGDAVARS